MPYEGMQGSEAGPFLLPDKKADLAPESPFFAQGELTAEDLLV